MQKNATKKFISLFHFLVMSQLSIISCSCSGILEFEDVNTSGYNIFQLILQIVNSLT